MDFKFKGRTWAGNIYHRFETMCQEVDDFVTKDSVKYVENQVQTVGESMKRFYSNVVHDFLPPVVDNKPNEGSLDTEKQNEVLATYSTSVVGIKGNLGHNKRKSFKEQSNASEVGNQSQHSFPPNFAFHQQAETDIYSEGGGNVCISLNQQVVHEENVAQEESPVCRVKISQDEKSSLNLKEQHLLPESFDSPADETVSGSTENSNDRDQRSNFLINWSPEKFVDNLDVRISQTDETVSHSDDLLGEEKSGLSLEQDGFDTICENAKMGPKENTTNKDHPVSEGANTFKEKDLSELISCIKEQHQEAANSKFLQDENLSVPSSANKDFKSSIHGKNSPVILGQDTGYRVVQMEETVCDNIDPSVEARADTSSEQHGNAAKPVVSLEESVAKDVPMVVECKSFSNDKSCLKLSVCLREQHPLLEEISNLKDENPNASSLIPTNENPNVTISAKFHPATSVHNQELRDFQDEESLSDIVGPSKEAGKNLSLEIDSAGCCLLPDLCGKENHMLTKRAVEKSIGSLRLKSSSDLSLCSTKLHLQAKESDSLGDDNLSKSFSPLSEKDHKNTVLANFSQGMSVHDEEFKEEFKAFQMDGTICSPQPSTELVSSNVCVKKKIAQAEFTSLKSSISMETLNLPDILNAPCTQKAEKSCYNCTDSDDCVSYISSISSGSFSDLAYDNKAVNPLPACLSRAVSAVSNGDGDDSAVDIADADMETIDLSDKVNLEESCIIVDNSLHHAASSRPRKFRSYKKLIQDAFASRKRLIKEYEQLAIWYGDIETEICLHPKQSPLLPVTATTSSSRTSQASDMCEPEWELL